MWEGHDQNDPLPSLQPRRYVEADSFNNMAFIGIRIHDVCSGRRICEKRSSGNCHGPMLSILLPRAQKTPMWAFSIIDANWTGAGSESRRPRNTPRFHDGHWRLWSALANARRALSLVSPLGAPD